MPERPSLLKLLANRRNARKCTGPKTPAGKHRASRNAVRHGFYAGDAVLTGGGQAESQAEFDELARGLHEALQPRDAYEAALVTRVVIAEWQWRRAVRFEYSLPSLFGSTTGCGDSHSVPVDAPSSSAEGSSPSPREGEVRAVCDSPRRGEGDADQDLSLLIREESRADREFHAALAALRRYRKLAAEGRLPDAAFEPRPDAPSYGESET